MDDTGRISKTLHSDASRIIFDPDMRRAVDNELPLFVEIDRAQAVMLVRSGLMDVEFAGRIISELDRIEKTKFIELLDLSAPRGSYLAYEGFLQSRLGDNAANLHLGRSRNDINATLLKLRLRLPVTEVITKLTALLRRLDICGRGNLKTVFVLHTHRQPAVPSTLAHHYAAFATALCRDLNGILTVIDDLQVSPLGAGTGGGTTLSISPDLTAQLLGFEKPAINSIDAVASRDLVLRLLASLAVLGSTLSRIAETLLIWLGDCGLAKLPDELVGSSSAMPHKRNAFLLEHVQGKAGALAGAFSAALIGMHAAPFTNCVSVGTEAVSQVWDALVSAGDMVELISLCIVALKINNIRVTEVLNTGFVNAMEAATQLTLSGEMGFRQAHVTVGRMVNEAVNTDHANILCTKVASELSERGSASLTLDPTEIALNTHGGGGAAPDTVKLALDAASNLANNTDARLSGLWQYWRNRKTELQYECTKLQDINHTFSNQ